MPKISVVAFLLLVSCCSVAKSQSLGVGVIAGNPTGISIKKWLHDGRAVDGAAAWSFDDHGSLQLHTDYLWHRDIPAISQHVHGWMPFYYGVGGRVGFRESNRNHNGGTRVGVRVPVGVTYLFEDSPFDVFFEVVPVLDVAPRTQLEVDAAIGVRYYFR